VPAAVDRDLKAQNTTMKADKSDTTSKCKECFEKIISRGKRRIIPY